MPIETKIADIIRSVVTCFVLVLLLTLSAFGAWYVGKHAAYLAITGVISSTNALAVLVISSFLMSLALTLKIRAEKKAQKELDHKTHKVSKCL